MREKERKKKRKRNNEPASWITTQKTFKSGPGPCRAPAWAPLRACVYGTQ